MASATRHSTPLQAGRRIGLESHLGRHGIAEVVELADIESVAVVDPNHFAGNTRVALGPVGEFKFLARAQSDLRLVVDRRHGGTPAPHLRKARTKPVLVRLIHEPRLAIDNLRRMEFRRMNLCPGMCMVARPACRSVGHKSTPADSEPPFPLLPLYCATAAPSPSLAREGGLRGRRTLR